MPDNRLFHKRLGHSEKVKRLTDLEEIAWYAYVLSADDFGVMRFDAITLQNTHQRLADRSKKLVQKMLERIRDVGLVHTFRHQQELYCWQLDWQDYQHITYPLRTALPRPPADLYRRATRATHWLFTVWPGGGRDSKLKSWSPPDDFEPETKASAPSDCSGTVQEHSGTVQDSARGRGLSLSLSPDLDPGYVPDPMPLYPYPQEKAPALPRRDMRIGFRPESDHARQAAADLPAAVCDRQGATRGGHDDPGQRMGGAHQGPTRDAELRRLDVAASADGGDAGGAASAREDLGTAAGGSAAAAAAACDLAAAASGSALAAPAPRAAGVDVGAAAPRDVEGARRWLAGVLGDIDDTH